MGSRKTNMGRSELLQLRLDGMTYAAIAVKAGISRQRVQQLLRPPTPIYNMVKRQSESRCAQCGILVRDGHVHHITSTNGDTYDDLSNLLYVCPTCHRSFHERERGSFWTVAIPRV
mgnify:CR=1 FL=1